MVSLTGHCKRGASFEPFAVDEAFSFEQRTVLETELAFYQTFDIGLFNNDSTNVGSCRHSSDENGRS